MPNQNERGFTRRWPLHVENLTVACNMARERDHAVVVELETPDPNYPGAIQFKAYPRGRVLWAYDWQNPFQGGFPQPVE